ncbi:hypothetical protein CDL15_Pgr004903 [Punica granatum]|uniref:COP1-interacting protein 7 n=1 Tax=Punica granatum TaxID=22663 RepID=A0A218W8A1_PUNGR|nr:hypothetical protein CDL15_Pgr004903 [Punica granatum]
MKSDVPLDHAVFQLSPKRSRCELIASCNGRSEKLASGLIKPFVTHLKVAEEQFLQNVQSIKLEAGKFNDGEKCLTKGTLERFVRFVSTPEVLELVNTIDAEMSQLEAARKIYSQGTGDQHSCDSGANEAGIAAAADATKKELLRAIDVRLTAVRQDLITACARASAAGFNPDSVSELRLFADCFGAYRLNEACTKFLLLYQRRPELIPSWKPSVDDCGVRSSCESDMSLDDPTEDAYDRQLKSSSAPSLQNRQLTGQTAKLNAEQSDVVVTQQSKFASPAIGHSINQKDSGEKSGKDDGSPDPLMIQTSQPARRLSVQDRINLFESKQKENTGGGSSSSGSKLVAAKPGELRRLSSDVSSAPAAVERAVLRRWSGASDMSLDLSAEKKDNNKESPSCTPSSVSSVSQAKSTMLTGAFVDKSPKELNVTAVSDKTDVKNVADKVSDVGIKDEGALQHMATGVSSKEEERSTRGSINRTDQLAAHMLKMPFSGRTGQVGSSQDGLQNNARALLGSEEEEESKTHKGGSEVRVRGCYQKEPKDQATIEIQTGGLSRPIGVASNNETGIRTENPGMKNEPVVQSRFRGLRGHSRSFSEQLDGGIRLKAVDTQEKGINGSQLVPPLQLKSHAGVYEETGKTELVGLGKLQISEEESAFQKIKSQKSVSSVPEQVERSQARRDEIGVYGNGKFSLSGRKASESQETSLTPPTAVVEPIQRVRQSKGNQELNDDLKMMANELEKLFAEHKLRVPGDQSSSRRSKPVDYQKEQAGNSENRNSAAPGLLASSQLPEKRVASDIRRVPSGTSNFSTPPSTKMIDNNLDLSDSLRKNFSELNDSRGKFYEKYMQKRDAKLKEECGSKRAEKEAKLKYMHDSLERSRAEMNARFSGSAERQDSISAASRRVEKLRSFNSQSSMKREQPIDFFQSEEEEEFSGSLEEKSYGPDKSFGEEALGDGAPRSTQTKRSLPNRNLCSSTARTSAAAASRSSVKASNFSSARRRAPSENPLAQSVPNFSDLRKENTKPSGVSKVVNRPQVRSYARSKSTSDDVPAAKEERTQRSQLLRRSSAGPGEFKESSVLSDDISVLAPLELDKEQSDSRPFLRKGNGIGPSVGAAKLKASIASQHLMNDEDFNDSSVEVDDRAGMVVENEEEEYQAKDSEHPRLSHESGNSGKSGTDNGDTLQPISQVNPALVPELPASVPSKFFSESLVLDSPGESPISWNSHVHHPFSFPHEASDIDASVDSPVGSPASWNSHSLVQTEADAARMRKKWGSAQKPILVSNSSHNQSRKDVTKGFKRLLKFGRKSRGAESLVDWISATTSEGDDDAEDGRDPANRSSEDLRKSRMGFPQSHSSDDVFIESDLSNDQANSSIPAPPANFKLRDDHISGSSLKGDSFSSFFKKNQIKSWY